MDHKKQSILVVLVVIIIASASFFYVNKSSESNISSNFTGSKEEETTNEKTYTSEVSYRVPRGNEIIKVELTISDEVITDSSVTHSHFDSHSTPHMQDFDAGYFDEVVGKNINEVDLDIVSGASLTTIAFMSAIEDIKSQI